MWNEGSNLAAASNMIIRITAVFEDDRAGRGTGHRVPRMLPKRPMFSAVNAQSNASAAKRALMKSVRAIDEYDGRIQNNATCKYLRDCERYFREIAQFAGAHPEEYNKVIRASGALKGRAA